MYVYCCLKKARFSIFGIGIKTTYGYIIFSGYQGT